MSVPGVVPTSPATDPMMAETFPLASVTVGTCITVPSNVLNRSPSPENVTFCTPPSMSDLVKRVSSAVVPPLGVNVTETVLMFRPVAGMISVLLPCQ
jgi:hypothetical protein